MRIENAIVSYATYVEKTIIPTGFAIIYQHPEYGNGLLCMEFVAIDIGKHLCCGLL
jgi:hypothetical protein